MKFNCEYCGKEKEIPLSYYKRRKHHFCSQECFLNSGVMYANRTKNEYIKICKTCGKKFKAITKDRMYCGNKCMGIANRKNNLIVDKGEFLGIIIIKNGKELICKIDREDYNKILDYRIVANYSKFTNSYYVYAISKGGIKDRKIIPIHRLVTNCPDELVVNHINHDTLDNRKQNLKVCTRSENCQNIRISKNNTSGVQNIYFDKNNSRYIYRKNINSNIHQKVFSCMEDAIAYKLKYEYEFKNYLEKDVINE